MIVGTVTRERDALVRVSVRGQGGHRTTLEVVVDTGFSGCLTLPPTVIRSLGLPYHHRGASVLSDGSVSEFNVYQATVKWDGVFRPVPVEEAEATPLLGMAMLEGYHLAIDIRTKGRVEITKLD